MKLKIIVLFFICITSAGADELICATGIDAFSRTLHPLLVQSCSKCHGDSGGETPHSSSDVKVSYSTSLKLVNFVKMQDSRIYAKVVQKHWLNYDPSQRGILPEDMLASLTSWWESGEKSCPKNYQFFTEKLTVPRNLPEAGTQKFVALAWKLDSLNPGLENCTFEIKIQRFTAWQGTVPGSFRVKDPSIRCSRPLHLSRLRLYLNGQTQSYENIYENLDLDVPASPRYQFLSQEEMILIERDQTSELELAFGTLDFI